jgi:protein-S-isoprenylcysteine O-methyltransferase
MNPVCTVAYIITLKKFFRDRIEHEEACLVDFFGSEYAKYRAKSFVLIPGID